MSGYLNFKPTGVPEIDAILRAVEVAGDAYHHTEDWGDDDNGESHIDRIQKAADAAALARRGAAMQTLEAHEFDPDPFFPAHCKCGRRFENHTHDLPLPPPPKGAEE